MRVIRTEVYFLPPDERLTPYRTGPELAGGAISIAWFRAPHALPENELFKLLEQEIGPVFHPTEFARNDIFSNTQKFFNRLLDPPGLEPPNDDEGAVTLNPRLRSELGQFGESFADAVLDLDVVIEQSPPSWEKLKKLVERSPGVLIGTYIGLAAGEHYPYLLFATVPTGIIVVGSAIGVSRALEQNLSLVIDGIQAVHQLA
jgi:hypothetical protein